MVPPAAAGREPSLGPSGEGTVVLDVGGDRGALVVWTPPGLAGSELEVRREGTPWRGEHTAVRPRRLRDGTAFAAVFGSLGGGHYELRRRGTTTDAVLGVDVAGGRVAEARWPEPATA